MTEQASFSQNPPRLPEERMHCQKRHSSSCLKVTLITLLIIVILIAATVSAFLVGIGAGAAFSETDSLIQGSGLPPVKQTTLIPGDADKKIAVIDIKGIIANANSSGIANSANIIKALKAAGKDSTVVAIIIDMDTPGGELIATDEIYTAIKKLDIPIITCMHSMGASGGYYIAAGTDHIIANRMTLTGSIGVIMSSINYTDLLDKIGVKSTPIKSGEMKDMLSGSRPTTEKERQYCQQLINESFNEFATVVANGRENYPDAESVKNSIFGDGRVLSGASAFAFGLVDELGDFNSALNYARSEVAAPNAAVVKFSTKSTFLDTLISSKADVQNMRSMLPVKSPQLEAGKLYLLAPTTL